MTGGKKKSEKRVSGDNHTNNWLDEAGNDLVQYPCGICILRKPGRDIQDQMESVREHISTLEAVFGERQNAGFGVNYCRRLHLPNGARFAGL